MSFDPILVLAAVLALAGIVFSFLVCSYRSREDFSCPARYWSRRPTWHERKSSSEKG